jgi:hypothetical protein
MRHRRSRQPDDALELTDLLARSVVRGVQSEAARKHRRGISSSQSIDRVKSIAKSTVVLVE